MQTVFNSKSRCYYCTKDVGPRNLKTCSKCRLVKYCSKECQRAAWPTHKTTCSTFDNTSMDDTDEAEFSGAMTKWMANWRHTLIGFCIPAMDLPNHPPDRLATHCVFIHLKRNRNPTTRAQSFSMIEGAIMTREAFVHKAINDLHHSREHIEGWKNDNRGAQCLHLCVGCENHMRFVWGQIPDANMPYFREMDPAETAVLAAVWEAELIAKIASGQPA